MASMKPNSGDNTIAAAVLRTPLATNLPTPAFATPAPMMPPTKAWEELDGMP